MRQACFAVLAALIFSVTCAAVAQDAPVAPRATIIIIFTSTPTPTPTLTPTPSATPTPTPTFDIGVTGVALVSKIVMNATPDLQRIGGLYALSIVQPEKIVDTTVELELRDTSDTLYFSKTEVLSATSLLTSPFFPILFDVPASPGLPLTDYVAVVHVDPDETYGEANTANNRAQSAPRFIAHISGQVRFGNIRTALTYNASSNIAPGPPLLLSGDGKLNGSIPIDYGGMNVTRDPATLDLVAGPGAVNVPFSLPDPYQPGNWRYRMTNTRLLISGAFATVSVYLPDFCSYQNAPGGLLFDRAPISLGVRQLNQHLDPTGDAVLNVVRRFYCEGVPFYVGGSGQTFSAAAGFLIHNPTKEYIQEKRLLAFGSIKPGVVREANDFFFGWPAPWVGDVFIRADGLEGSLDGVAAYQAPSWPWQMAFSYSNYKASFRANRIVPASSEMTVQNFLGVLKTSSCAEDACYPCEKVLTFSAAPVKLKMGSDGHLLANELLPATQHYEFNTYVFDASRTFRYYQPGFIVSGKGAPDPKHPIDPYLLSPRAEDGSKYYPYGSAEAWTGEGLFAGLNMLREDLAGTPFGVSIDAHPGNPLTLAMNEYSKFYFRTGGYSGIIDAGSLVPPANLELYPDPCGKSYQVTLTGFGQAFLDNDPRGWDSRIDGLIDIPWPSNIEIAFEKMLLNGCGNFEGGEIPEEEQDKTKNLAYWNADLKVQTLEFQKRDPMGSDDDRTLWISSVNTVDHLSVKPVMQLNLNACGDIPESSIREEIVAQFDDYNQSIQQIYLNRWDGNPTSPNGFYSIVGETHFPFFGASRTHAFVKSTVAHIAGGEAYFDMDDPDLDDDGFPDSSPPSGGTASQRIENYADTRLVRVDKEFANVFTLDYDVKYNNFEKRFKSKQQQVRDLLVLEVESEVRSLDQQHAEIGFGATYTGLNLSSFADDFASQVQGTFLEPVRDRLDTLNSYLGGDLSTFLRPALQSAVQSKSQQFVNAMKSLVAGVPDANVKATINANFAGGGSNLGSLLNALDLKNYLQGATNPAMNTLNDIFGQLGTVKEALKFDPGELDPLLSGVASGLLSQFGISTNLNIDDFKAPVEEARQQVLSAITGEIEPKIQTAANVLNPAALIPDIFKTVEVDKINGAIESALKSTIPNLSKDAILNLDPDEVTNAILNELFNSDAFMDLNTKVTNELFPIKDELLGQAVGLLDKVNQTAKDFLDEAAGGVSSVEKSFKDVIGLRAASLEGYAVISYETLEKIHIDAAFALSIPDDMEFKGFFDMTRYQVNNEGENCFANLPGEEILDIKIGAQDVDLGWTGQELKADLTFGLMLLDLKLANVSGSIVTKGAMTFETVEFSDLGFGVAIGAIENYLWAKGQAKFNNYQMSGGIFLGTSCSMEPLLIIDPAVAALLPITQMRGVYAGVGGSFPVYDYSCFFRVGVEAGVKAWYFADGPTYGGIIRGGFYGKVACIVSAKGVMEIGAGKSGGEYFFSGNAWVAGGIGWCDPEDWHKPSDVWKDSWCYTCVAYLDMLYKSSGGWDVDYDVDCE